MASGGATSGGSGNGNGNNPSAPSPDSNSFDFGFGGLPFISEVAASGLRGIVTNTAPCIQNIVGFLDEQNIQKAMRMSVGDSVRKIVAGGSEQFKETVNVDKTGKKYGLDIVLGSDAKPESLKISRKDNILTVDVKMEKTAQDGSSRLYQEYTRKLTLPVNVDLSQLESSLSPEGILNIQAPLLPVPEAAQPSSIKIPVTIEDDIITD